MRGLILLFGGGDNGMIDDLLVYSTENGNWFQPSTNGQVPSGVAAFGMAADGTRIIVHGGMQEYGKLTNVMYELQEGLFYITNKVYTIHFASSILESTFKLTLMSWTPAAGA